MLRLVGGQVETLFDDALPVEVRERATNSTADTSPSAASAKPGAMASFATHLVDRRIREV